eukprot:3333696-Amphidinium_carterae.1
MVSSYVARTPFSFVKSASTTRKNDELTDSQESESKRRKVEELVSLLDTAPDSGQKDVTMGTSSGEVLYLRGGKDGEQRAPHPSEVLALQEETLDRTGSSPVDVLDQGEEDELVLSTTKELKVMKEEDEIQFWKQMWKE